MPSMQLRSFIRSWLLKPPPQMYKYLPHVHVLCFILRITEFNQGRLCRHGFGTVYWCLEASTFYVCIQLKEWLPLSQSSSVANTPAEIHRTPWTLSHPLWIMDRLSPTHSYCRQVFWPRFVANTHTDNSQWSVTPDLTPSSNFHGQTHMWSAYNIQTNIHIHT